MDVIYGMRRPLSASLCVKGSGDVSNAQLIDGQPSGDLLSFLTTSYPNGDAVEVDFRNSGGTIIARATAGDVTAVGFTTDVSGRPVLSVSTSEASVVELRLAIPHSITH